MKIPANSGPVGRGVAPSFRASRRSALTLIEAIIALALAVLLCAGLFSVGLKGQRVSEHARLAMEARALGKERMEGIIALGLENLRQPSCTLLNTDTNASSRGYPIVRRTQAVWHAADRGPSDAATGVYVEVHVDIVYESIHSGRMMTDTFATVIQ